MALLRWIYLRKLVPIEGLIAGLESGSGPAGPGRPAGSSGRGEQPAGRASEPRQPVPSRSAPAAPEPTPAGNSDSTARRFKDAFLAEIKSSKPVFYNMIVAQARRIDVSGENVTFTFSPAQRTLLNTFEQTRPWLEELAQRIGGSAVRPTVTGVQEELAAASRPAAAADSAGGNGAARGAGVPKASLREQAMADAGVKALLEVFPAEIRDVEEMEP
jgi:hypothetical protein